MRVVYLVFSSAFLSILSSQSGSGLSITDARSGIYRLRRQTDCDGFRCIRSGQCIDEDSYCDGKVDCLDGTDETERCKTLGCATNAFRCKYGACISKRAHCDGKIDCKDGSDELGSKCNVTKVNSRCKYSQFECKNGQCISGDDKCDGTPDCDDKSDETHEACAKLACPGYTFKCRYGACISLKGVCNGISECYDESDEDPILCNGQGSSSVTPPIVTPVSRPVTPVIVVTPSMPPRTGNRPPAVTAAGSCILPPAIVNGGWSVWGNTQYDYQTGDRVTHSTFLEIKCRNGYDVDGPTRLLFCDTGRWTPQVPQCLQICSPLESTPSTVITCTYQGRPANCSKPFEGTYAKYECAQFYELSIANNILYCSEGTWDETRPTCTPVCGEKTVTIKELIIGGNKVEKGNYPWTIALYKLKASQYSHICGGSLINQRVIVTAAHCVSNPNGKPYSESLFKVGAGKFFRAFNEPNDTDAEFSDIAEVHVHPKYQGSTFDYEYDIAVLVTKEPFNTTKYIQRVCIDWDLSSYYESHLLGTNGTVTGWGYTIRGKEPSEVLKEISLPYVDYSTCLSGMTDKYKKYVRNDKMCAGYLNLGIGVCEGDSGGGLVFQNLNNKNRYYLRGVVSVAPQVGGDCDEYKYALYTKISTYVEFIGKIERKFRKLLA